MIPELIIKRPQEVNLYPLSRDDRLKRLGTMFGSENIQSFNHEITVGPVGLSRLINEYAPDFDSYYFENYMPQTFTSLKEIGPQEKRNAYRRYYDVANTIALEASRTLFPTSDYFDAAREIMLSPDSPSSRAINYLSGQMTVRTEFEYFRHLAWVESAGKFIGARERTCFNNLWQNLTENLCQVKMGETSPVAFWSIHDNATNAVLEILHNEPTAIPENAHCKFHAVDMYELHPTQGGSLRFNLSPRLKEAKRAVPKYEEAVISRFENPEGKLTTDALGTAVYLDGDNYERDDFVETFQHWFSTQYPNSKIEERSLTNGTKGKGVNLNWKRFKLIISPVDDPSIQNGGARAEFIVSTMKDYFTNEYELDSPNSSSGSNDGRAHKLHELRRLQVLRPYHQPNNIYFPKQVADGREEQVEQGLNNIMLEAIQRTRNQLLRLNRWDSKQHQIFVNET